MSGSRFRRLRMPQKMPPRSAGCHWTTVDLDGCGELILGRDSTRFLAVFAPQRTFSDLLERYWMVGRVGIEPVAN